MTNARSVQELLGLRDDELYVAIPGDKWQAFGQALSEVVGANERMRAYYVAHEAFVTSNK